MSARFVVLVVFVLGSGIVVDDAWGQSSQFRAPTAQRSQRAQGNKARRSNNTFNRPNVGRDPASQQMANIYNRKTVSPYLNLLRQQGANSSPNYQAIVRPQFEQKRLTNQRASALQDLGKQVAAKKDRTNADQGEGIRATGHASTFMGHTSFFNTNKWQRN